MHNDYFASAPKPQFFIEFNCSVIITKRVRVFTIVAVLRFTDIFVIIYRYLFIYLLQLLFLLQMNKAHIKYRVGY